MKRLRLSVLPRTWLIDIDGILFPHNEYLKGKRGRSPMRALDGSAKFVAGIPTRDVVILLTSRKRAFRSRTVRDLRREGIRYDLLIMDLPLGERVLINDAKPRGLGTAHAVVLRRDVGLRSLEWIEDPSL